MSCSSCSTETVSPRGGSSGRRTCSPTRTSQRARRSSSSPTPTSASSPCTTWHRSSPTPLEGSATWGPSWGSTTKTSTRVCWDWTTTPCRRCVPPASSEGGTMAYRLGVDVGGTFTDILLIDEESGATYRAKTSSTPEDQSIGVLRGIERACEAAGVTLGDIDEVFHGTTVATNAILEGK